MATLDLATLLKAKRVAPPQPAIVPPEREEMAPRVANSSLSDRCEVLAFTSAQDETGGVSEAWAQVGAYPCRVEDTGAGTEQSTEAAGVQSVAPYRVYLPKSARVSAQNRLGIPAWFNVFNLAQTYHKNDAVILSDFDGWIYTCVVPTSVGVAPASPNWRPTRRAQFLEVTSVIDADSNNDCLIALCKNIQ